MKNPISFISCLMFPLEVHLGVRNARLVPPISVFPLAATRNCGGCVQLYDSLTLNRSRSPQLSTWEHRTARAVPVLMRVFSPGDLACPPMYQVKRTLMKHYTRSASKRSKRPRCGVQFCPTRAHISFNVGLPSCGNLTLATEQMLFKDGSFSFIYPQTLISAERWLTSSSVLLPPSHFV
jgi:hypothetical protein